ncbi:phosphatidylinositol N-acetylglucosaminyltransferase [Ophiocordyceps camponoti-floridani]|uniref:Phosphatidylinositol N-acetylglucosaminyltransferase n=1 Tax=Ophiocordyceps camponoti-floridani TaxID=2030778 RepID=A0A8H4Q435_9HYPO|nr:phosphatidylinositol N-acetylglucosaminyltransferase [Ophiocordyceps camponoti-floridani]
MHARESLLVLRGLGVQTTEQSSSYLTRPATRFIPTEKIQDIFINEAFRGFQVRYYLVVVVEAEPDVVVVFPGLLPPRHIVEAVWRGTRECLYEGRAEEKAVPQQNHGLPQ